MMQTAADGAGEQLQLLLDVCRLISSKLDLGELLRTVLQLASRLVKAETASLLLLDPATDELYFHVALGLDPQVAKIRLKLGQGIAGSVALEGSSAVINDVRSDPRWSSLVDRQSGFQTRSILAAPMRIKGRLIGVVEAINRIGGGFSDEETRLFEAFASQAAIAIDNAQLVASLRDEKAKLDTVFARMTDAAVLTDEKGRILLYNDSARKYFTIGAEAPGTISDGLSQVRVVPPVDDILRSREDVVPFEATRELPKKLVLAGSATALTFDQDVSTSSWRGRLLVFRDVTEERKEELLKRSFLSLISHKLKTPLASITGYAQILLDDCKKGGARPQGPSGAGIKYLETVLAQGKKLSELVEKLLRFVTLDELDTANFLRKPFPAEEAVSQAIEALREWLAARNGKVLFQKGAGHAAFGNPNLVREAVRNLIENAVKFDPKPEKTVAVWTETADGFVTIHVKDRGPGIPPEEQDRVFSKFYQVEQYFTGQVEGWGLGLPFVKKVMESHGGRIALSSKLGEGTTVSLVLPCPPAA